jgi:hypothetical protein
MHAQQGIISDIKATSEDRRQQQQQQLLLTAKEK